MSEITLKPCPFCGAQPSMMHAVHEYWVRCECHAITSMHSTESQAAAMWNRRVDDDGVFDGVIEVTPSNCREVLPKFSRKQMLAFAVEAMTQLNVTIENNNKCVAVIEHFERAYKTRDAKKIAHALAMIFDKQPVKRNLQ